MSSNQKPDKIENPDSRVPFWGTQCNTHHFPDGSSYEWFCSYRFWINTGCNYAGGGINP